MNYTAIAMTAIICITLVFIAYFGKDKKQK